MCALVARRRSGARAAPGEKPRAARLEKGSDENAMLERATKEARRGPDEPKRAEALGPVTIHARVTKPEPHRVRATGRTHSHTHL